MRPRQNLTPEKIQSHRIDKLTQFIEEAEKDKLPKKLIAQYKFQLKELTHDN